MFHEILISGAIRSRSKIKSEKGKSFGLIVSTYRIILVQKVNAGSQKESVIGFDIERLVSREGCSGLLGICIPSAYNEKKFIP